MKVALSRTPQFEIVMALPFGIDVSARSVWGQKKLVSFGDNNSMRLRRRFFLKLQKLY
jgi:hypothetical protein